MTSSDNAYKYSSTFMKSIHASKCADSIRFKHPSFFGYNVTVFHVVLNLLVQKEHSSSVISLQCTDTVGLVTGRASGL